MELSCLKSPKKNNRRIGVYDSYLLHDLFGSLINWKNGLQKNVSCCFHVSGHGQRSFVHS